MTATVTKKLKRIIQRFAIVLTALGTLTITETTVILATIYKNLIAIAIADAILIFMTVVILYQTYKIIDETEEVEKGEENE